MSFLNQDIIVYEDAAREISKANTLPFVPVHKEFLEAGGNLWSHDGLHPNDAGHQLIFELVRPALDQLLAGG
jgi:lysophospholipase L1-like esterase